MLKILDTLDEKLKTATTAAIGLQESTQGVGRQLKSAGKSAEKASGGFKQFSQSIARIAKYRILRTILRELTQAFKEGLKNAYNFSKGIGGDLASAMDTMSTKTLTMKNQLGAAFGQLLTNLMPIILKIIDLVTRAANAITQLFAVLGGKGTYLKAVDSTADMAKNLGGGASAAKELRRTLMGFDEINRLDAPDSGGGGGGGGNATDYSNMFKIAEIDGWAARLKAWIDKLDVEPLKKSWDEFKTTVGDFAKLLGGYVAGIAKKYIEEYLPVALDLLSKLFHLLSTLYEKLEPVIKAVGDWQFELLLTGLQGFSGVLEDIDNVISGGSILEFLVHFPQHIGEFTSSFNPAIAIGQVFGNLFGTEIASIIQTTKNDISDFVDRVGESWDKAMLKLDELKGKVSKVWEDIKSWWNTNVAKYFTKDYWQEKINNMFNVTPPHIPMPHFEVSWEPAGALASFFGFSAIPHINLAWYAQGGFPEDGLFMANHGELVGQFSNGRTAVANNEQIIAGIERGVYNAMTAAMGNRNGGENVVRVYLDGKQISNAVTRSQRQTSRATGVAFA